MPLIYSCIARGNVILVERNTGPGNISSEAQNILADFTETGNRKTTKPGDEYLFHTVTCDGLAYLCTADKDLGRRIPYLFLEEVQRKFSEAEALKQRSAVAGERELNRDFRNILANTMDDFNSGKGDQLSVMQKQVGEVTGIMRQNVEKVLDRGDKLDDLVDKTEDLQASANTFKVNAVRIQRKMFWQNRKMMIIIVVVVLVLITIIVLVVLGSQGVI